MVASTKDSVRMADLRAHVKYRAPIGRAPLNGVATTSSTIIRQRLTRRNGQDQRLGPSQAGRDPQETP